jgi:hypothetical protein
MAFKLVVMRILPKRQPLGSHCVYLEELEFWGSLDLGKYVGLLRSYTKL